MSQVYLHIGYSKAASTTLQNYLFACHDEFTYFGPGGKDHNASINDSVTEMFDKIVYMPVIDYEQGDVKNNHKRQLSLIRRQTVNKPIVFSKEQLTQHAVQDNGVKGQRLKALFPRAKIICIIRNQFDILVSRYNMKPYHPFLKLPISRYEQKMPLQTYLEISLSKPNTGVFPSLRYFETIEYYASLFGRDRLGIFLFEELVREPRRFAQKISRFLGVHNQQTVDGLLGNRANVATSHYHHTWISRLLRKLFPVYLLPSTWTQKAAILFKTNQLNNSVKTDTKKAVKNYFAESNRQLEKAWNLGLKKYDYFPITRK
jgi:hypothetical protein